MTTTKPFWAVRINGVQNFEQLQTAIKQRYPGASVRPLDEPGYVGVILPQPYWRATGHGDTGFFNELVWNNVIAGYEEKRVEE